ncbi:hypothetical protein C0W59_03090 [Photobacterium kishitanii]|uniref:hypothetical protein n=1 Tax=Photobacterium kishitanii TaxID=318456 RepID=UPI000D159FB5|nr:hypothetical protein [Photobacterium kishitanii]PSV18234.1 hypothetical protein C0W59_03090 [Photobacterium kishitanii]
MKSGFKILFLFSTFFISNNVYAFTNCIEIENNILYTLTPNINICLNTEKNVTLIKSYEQNLSIFSIQSENELQPQIMFPDEWVHIKGKYNLQLTEKMYLYKNHNIVLLMDERQIIKFFIPISFAKISPGSIIGAGITSADQGPKGVGNAIIGASVGNVISNAVTVVSKNPGLGEVAGAITGKLVTDHLNNGPKTHPSFKPGVSNINGHGFSGVGNCINCHTNQ